MSFNKKFIPNVDELNNMLETNGSEYFYNAFIKSVDALIGSDESLKFIENFESQYKHTKDAKAL